MKKVLLAAFLVAGLTTSAWALNATQRQEVAQLKRKFPNNRFILSCDIRCWDRVYQLSPNRVRQALNTGNDSGLSSLINKAFADAR